MKIFEKLTKGYTVEVSKEHWMVVSKTINLYHQLIAGPILIKSLDNTVICTFEYYMWNEKQIDMMLSALMLQLDGIEVTEM